MHLIVYTSECSRPLDDVNQKLDQIREAAKKNNPSLEITGVLFYHSGQFLQVIEGEKEKLEELMALLETDSRHENIERLIDIAVTKRRFQNWNMDSFNLNSDTGIDRDELITIADAFKVFVGPNSDLLVRFYKTMVEAGTFRH